jgi:hypothetical protein
MQRYISQNKNSAKKLSKFAFKKFTNQNYLIDQMCNAKRQMKQAQKYTRKASFKIYFKNKILYSFRINRLFPLPLMSLSLD